MTEPRATKLDPEKAKAILAEQEARFIEKRAGLLRAALWAALHRRGELREKLRSNAGVWWEELEPLGPTERIAIIVKLREAFGLPPDPRMKPAVGRPKLDVPHLGRPE